MDEADAAATVAEAERVRREPARYASQDVRLQAPYSWSEIAVTPS